MLQSQKDFQRLGVPFGGLYNRDSSKLGVHIEVLVYGQYHIVKSGAGDVTIAFGASGSSRRGGCTSAEKLGCEVLDPPLQA